MKNLVGTLLGLIFLGPVAQARPEISIPSQVEVSQREVLRLSDIAVVTDGTDELLGLLENIVIKQDARELLLSQTLKSADILTQVRAEMENDESLHKLNPAFKIPSEVKVSFSATPISKQAVERQLLNVLKVRCPDCEFRISLQNIPVPSTKNWELDMSGVTLKNSFLVPLQEGNQANNKWLSGNIHTSKLTPVANKMIIQGERIQAADVRMAVVDITFAKDSAVKIEDIQGQAAARSLSAGSPIFAADLRREPAAKRGQMVQALLGNNDFEISSNMQAEENGYIGDTIKVKNLESQKVLSGVVTDKGVVKLQ